MRVPIFISIPACILAVFLSWWIGTRKIDFTTPPTEAKLEQIRIDALASIAVSETQQDAISIIVPTTDSSNQAADPLTVEKPVEIGDLSPPQSLDTYSDRAPDGSNALLRLGKELELRGAFQRALFANERVLDLSQANSEQIQDALIAIQRIRPTLVPWNRDPALSHQVVIRIGTGEKFAKTISEIMEPLAKELRFASSGLISFSYKLNVGRSIQTTDAPTPIAIWITGADENSPSTDVLSFTTDNPETLRKDLLKTIFNLVRGQLSKTTSYNPAPEATNDPMTALSSNITRLLWNEFGNALKPKNNGQ